jgi:ABC-type transporter MlaC component
MRYYTEEKPVSTRCNPKALMVLAALAFSLSISGLGATAKSGHTAKKNSSPKISAPTKNNSAANKDCSEKEMVEGFIAAVTRPDADKHAKAGFDEAAQLMAFDEMAKRAFGDAGWPKFSPAEQKEIVVLFRRLIEIRFYPRWRRVFQNGKFEVEDVQKGADSIVSGSLNADGRKSALSFRLTKTPEGYRLVSMSVKEKDMLERTSVRLKRGLANKGAAGLIAHLRKRTQEAQKDSNYKPPLEELISGGK